MSRCRAADHGLTSTLSLMHIVISPRTARKPACISAQIERAHARARGAAGQNPGCRSARYSAIAMLSQTTVSGCVPASTRQGTSPLGENSLYTPVRSLALSETTFSANGAPLARTSSQPRSDQLE